jgi:hypothetical protein
MPLPYAPTARAKRCLRCVTATTPPSARVRPSQTPQCTVQEGSDNPSRAWSAVVTGPYCSVFTASVARPAHFARFAQILKEASDGVDEVNHNDISLACLMLEPSSFNEELAPLVDGDNSVVAAITAPDAAAAYFVGGGLATPKGTKLSAHVGNHIFVH